MVDELYASSESDSARRRRWRRRRRIIENKHVSSASTGSAEAYCKFCSSVHSLTLVNGEFQCRDREACEEAVRYWRSWL